MINYSDDVSGNLNDINSRKKRIFGWHCFPFTEIFVISSATEANSVVR